MSSSVVFLVLFSNHTVEGSIFSQCCLRGSQIPSAFSYSHHLPLTRCLIGRKRPCLLPDLFYLFLGLRFGSVRTARTEEPRVGGTSTGCLPGNRFWRNSLSGCRRARWTTGGGRLIQMRYRAAQEVFENRGITERPLYFWRRRPVFQRSAIVLSALVVSSLLSALVVTSPNCSLVFILYVLLQVILPVRLIGTLTAAVPLAFLGVFLLQMLFKPLKVRHSFLTDLTSVFLACLHLSFGPLRGFPFLCHNCKPVYK